MRMRALLCLAGLVAACHSPALPPDPAAPRQVIDVQRFAVSKDGRRLGTLVQREIRDPQRPVRYYLVENAAGQWLGYVDEQGRFYRYEPFVERERFLGVYPMDKGLGLLYDVGAPLRIVPEAREAAASRERPR